MQPWKKRQPFHLVFVSVDAKKRQILQNEMGASRTGKSRDSHINTKRGTTVVYPQSSILLILLQIVLYGRRERIRGMECFPFQAERLRALIVFFMSEPKEKCHQD